LAITHQKFQTRRSNLPTTNEAIDALAAFIGFDHSRAKAVARALTDAAVLPPGGPGKSPELNSEHVVDLALGCSVDAPLRGVAAAVRAYRALAPNGADLSGAPAGVTRSAGSALDIWADIAVHGDADILRRDQIEVVSNWPEIAIYSGERTTRYVEPGALASHWQSSGHRRSTTICGLALVDCLRELFPNGDK
jgi:hypothetical protein